jgi:hypothetical protein
MQWNQARIVPRSFFGLDGVDGRDQHLLISVNTLPVREWDRSFGKVYKGMIDAGA